MSKPEYEFFDTQQVSWRPAAGNLPGLTEAILAYDQESGVATRLLKFEPGTDTSPIGVQVHDFWEEVYILEGSLHDLTLNRTFPRGYYACRPPGMGHGPWVAPQGCITFEVRYYSGKPEKKAEPAGSR